MHKYIALPGMLSDKAKESFKHSSIAMFYYIEREKRSPEGYGHIMDLAHGAYGVAALVEDTEDGVVFICKEVYLESMKTEEEKEKALREFRI